MAKKRERGGREYKVTMDMTPMIDVVFQLLIFFIVTMKPQDVLGRLDVFRPQPDPNAIPEVKPDEMLRITVHASGKFMLNQHWMTLATLEKNLKKAADISKKQTILIQCAEASSHGNLVAVLDLCAKVALTELCVVTLPPGSTG